MQSVIQAYLAETKIGRSQTYRNLSVFPLLSSHSATIDYMTLDEALAEHMIDIAEVNEAGSVPELKVVNKSPRMTLILDGEELVGAKQNRVVNTTILIQGQSTTVIPVSCVEQGRWAHESPRLYSKKRVMSPQLRARKAEQVHCSIKSSKGFRSDQGVIWDEIANKAERLNAQSPTMSMSVIYEKKRSSLADYLKHFRPVGMQVGAVFLINGTVVGVDTFGKQETLRNVFRKLVESYTLDTVDWLRPGGTNKALRRRVRKFLEDISETPVDNQQSVGLGVDCRLESKKITGLGLAYDDQVIHLSVFARQNGNCENFRSSKMQRLSIRRRFRQ